MTPVNIYMETFTIRINKSYQRLGGEDVVSMPKTPKSNREITIPAGLRNCLEDYMKQCYRLSSADRLFPHTKHYSAHEIERSCKLSGVKKIRGA